MPRKLNPEAKLAAIRTLLDTVGSPIDFTVKARAILDAPEPKAKKLSRIEQWQEAAGDAQDAANRLLSLQEEYQDWRDGLPENLENSPVAEKLDAVLDLDVQGLSDTADECSDADLPRGFGND